MRMILSLALVGITAALSLPTAARAGADTEAEVIAARCIARIQEMTEAAVTHIGAVTARTIQAIEKAQANGDREAAATAARNGINRARQAGRRAAAALEETVQRCARAIRRAGGGRELVARVIDAGRSAGEALEGAVRRCSAAIRQALAS